MQTALLTVHPPDSVVKRDGRPYTVSTPFSRAWKALPTPRNLLPAPDRPGRVWRCQAVALTSHWSRLVARPKVDGAASGLPARQDEAVEELDDGSSPI